MTETGQDFTIRRGEGLTFPVAIPGEAGATQAWWYVAEDRRAAVADRDLVLQTGGSGIVLSSSGPDVTALVSISAEQSEGLPVGPRHHELWLQTTAGPRCAAEGTITVLDSLRA